MVLYTHKEGEKNLGGGRKEDEERGVLINKEKMKKILGNKKKKMTKIIRNKEKEDDENLSE